MTAGGRMFQLRAGQAGSVMPLRQEVLNAEWFTSTRQAQIVINQWLRQYNHVRPHTDRGGWTCEVHCWAGLSAARVASIAL